MKVLFLGGTGIISTACTQLAVARGFHVTLLNRAQRPALPGTHQITADIADPAATAAALGKQNWDTVVDFIAYTPAEIEQRIALFRGRTGQYVFISSASAYQKPLAHYLITESTPLANPFWDYSRNKAAGEERLQQAWREEAFPATTVRPSLTYGDTVVPLAVNSWLKSYTAVDRMRRGQPVIVPGDGLSLWTITHNSDFAKGLIGLLGQQAAIGNAFHITSDEVLTWNQIYQFTAEAAGVPAPGWCISPPTSSRSAFRKTRGRCWATNRTPPCSTTPRSNASCPILSAPHDIARALPARSRGSMPTRRAGRLARMPALLGIG